MNMGKDRNPKDEGKEAKNLRKVEVGKNRVSGVAFTSGFDGYVSADEENNWLDYAQFAFRHVMNNNIIYPREIVDNLSLRNRSVIESILNECAAAYYTEVNTALIDDAYDKLLDILGCSAEIVAIIGSIYRLQNQRNVKDEHNRPMVKLFNGMNNLVPDFKQSSEYRIADNEVMGTFGISEFEWSNEVLSHLDDVRLPKKFKSLLLYLTANNILYKAKDTTVQWAAIQCYSDALGFTSNVYMNKDALFDALDKRSDKIQEDLAAYNFLSVALFKMGFGPGVEEDLTRDKKGKTLHYIDDKYGDYETMIYNAQFWSDTNGTDVISKFSAGGRLSRPMNEELHVENGTFYTPELSDFDVSTVTNMLRGGALVAMNIIALYDFNAPNSEPPAYTENIAAALEPSTVGVLEFTDTSDADKIAILGNIVQHNTYLSELRVFNGWWKLLNIMNGEDSHNDRFYSVYGTYDYRMDAGAIKIAMAQATYDFLFIDCDIAEIADHRTVSINTPANTNTK